MVTRSHCPQVTKEELEGDRWWELYQDTKRESTSGKVSLSCKIVEWIQANCRIWAAPNLTGYMKRLLTQDRLGQGSPESCPEWFQWDRCRTSSTRGGLQAWCTRGTGAKKSKVKGYYSWQPGQQEPSQGIWSEGKGTLLSLGDQSWFPLDKLTRSPKLNSTGRAAPLTLIQ